jgi:hypothetical protein
MIHFVVPADHTAMMREYLELHGKDMNDRLQVVMAESLPGMASVPPGTYVLSALDQLPPAMAKFIARFHAALSRRDDVRFLNHPTRTLQRFALLEMLHARGYNSFRAIRISDDVARLSYPVFVRDESTHEGALSPLLRSRSEVEAAVGRLLIQGRSARNLMVVEFCDTADSAGYYRKYSAFVLGGHILPRSLSYSPEWMLKFHGTAWSTAMAQEELDYVKANPHESALRELFALANVEYGRADYAIKDGRIEMWEMNLNPTIGRGLRKSTGRIPPEVDAIRDETKRTFYHGFREAWDSVNLAAPQDISIPLSIDAEIVRAAQASAPATGAWMAQIKRVLRPVKPILEPVVARALPFLGRAAMRRTQG